MAFLLKLWEGKMQNSIIHPPGARHTLYTLFTEPPKDFTLLCYNQSRDRPPGSIPDMPTTPAPGPERSH
jgi:hypothetical protein